MTQHNEQVEKWQREAKERLQPTLTNTRGVKKAVLDFARLLLGDFWQAQQKDLDTLISQIIADTERIAQQEVQEAVDEYKQFVINVLDGVDIADGYCNTKAIRFALQSRISTLKSKQLEDKKESI